MSNWLPTPAALAAPPAAARPAPDLERLLRTLLASGLLAVLLVPALRGSSAWLGWWPMWLVAMPGVAWWASHRFRLPRLHATVQGSRRRRGGGQARRCPRPASVPRDRAA